MAVGNTVRLTGARRESVALVAVLLALLAAASCRSTSGDPPAGAAEATDSQQMRMRELWAIYMAREPTWPDAREEWIQMGEEARQVLLDNLFLELSRTTDTFELDQGQMPRWERARRELVYLRSDAIPFLIEALRFFADAERRDPVMLDRVTLALAGLDVYEEMVSLLEDDASSERLRYYSVQTLLKGADPRNPEMLARVARQDPDWQLRSLAIRGLAEQEELSGEALHALIQASSDEDRFVRSSAVQGLGRVAETEPAARRALVDRLGDPDRKVRQLAVRSLARARTLPVRVALVDCYEQALRAGDQEAAEAVVEVLRFNTGQVLEGGVEAWRAWLEAEGRR